MSHTTQPLNIAIYGAGQIGSTFAYQMVTTAPHHHVTLITRPNSKRYQQLKRDQAVVASDGQKAQVSVTDQLDESISYDILLVTIAPAHNIYPLLPSIRRSTAKHIQYMVSTFTPEKLFESEGPTDRYSMGFPMLQAKFDNDGKLTMNIMSRGAALTNSPYIQQIYNTAGIPTTLEPDMLSRVRCQAVIGMVMESVCYTAEKHKSGATWSEAMTGARGIHAGFQLINTLGYKVYPTAPPKMLYYMPVYMVAGLLYGLTRVTSFRELLAGGVEESKQLIDSMLDAAKPNQVPALQALRHPD